MKIDWMVSKHTMFLIDLHWPVIGFVRSSIDDRCSADRMCRLHYRITALMSPNVYFVPVSCRRAASIMVRVGGPALVRNGGIVFITPAAGGSVVGLDHQDPGLSVDAAWGPWAHA